MGKTDLELGLTCFGCGAQFDGKDLGSDYAEALDRLDEQGGIAGWCMGHRDGQAHYVCKDCTDAVFDPVPIGRLCRHSLKTEGA